MKLHSRLKSLCGAALLGATAAASAPAMATNEAMLDLLKALYENGQITAEQYELISNAAKADAEEAEGIKMETKQVAEEASKKVDEKIAQMPNVTTDGKLVIESADGDWAFQPIGRIFWDTMWVDDDTGIEESGTELRRARLGFEATFMKYFEAKLELDFATSIEPSWKDVWIAYVNKNNLGKYNLKFGQQHVPFGHATISSSKYMPLMRRPLFGDGPQRIRNVGVSFRQESAEENRWFLHTGFFLESLPETDDEVNTDSGPGGEGVFAAIRAGGTPIYKDKQHLFHVGASYQWQGVNGDTFNNIDNALLTHIGDGDTLEADFSNGAGDTGDPDDVNSFDVEAIAIWGPMHAVGEFVYWDVSDPDGDASLYAWAFDAGWFLTGESMKYKYGAFSGISPNSAVGKGGIGAWQVAARIENMDLNDGDAIDGGEAYVFTAGLNWYPVKNVRFMANYATAFDIECENTNPAFDGCNTAGDGASPHAFSLRGQVYW